MNNINKLLLLFLVVFVTHSCKDKCKNETKVRFHNQTGVRFGEIQFKDTTFVFDFRDGTTTPYYTLVPRDFISNDIVVSGYSNLVRTPFTDEQLESISPGCNTFHFTDVDTIHVFNDTTLWYHITKED